MAKNNLFHESFLRDIYNFASSFKTHFTKHLPIEDHNYLLYIRDPVTSIFEKHKIIVKNKLLVFDKEEIIYNQLNKLIVYSDMDREIFEKGLLLYQYDDKNYSV